ncbi:MAG: cold shock domain-containing protein [Caulobacteraceae bacterium]|nr:cold shock domain-containing protein [Caulobacteraceae bacterium]
MKGAIKSYDPRRGSGIISRDDGRPDVMFYANELENAGLARVASGERLSFDVKTDLALKRSFAVNLSKL